MLSVNSFEGKKLHKVERVNIDHRKVCFAQFQKVFVLSLRDSRCDDFSIDLMNIDEIMNDVSDVFAELNLIQKEKIGFCKIYAELNLHE